MGDSARDDMMAQFEELSADGSAGDTPAASPSLQAATAPDVPSEPSVESSSEPEAPSGRARDDKGRFASKEGQPNANGSTGEQKPAPPPKPKPSATGGGEPISQGPVETAAGSPSAAPKAPAPAPDAPKPPQAWKAAIREKWSGLPPEVQAEVLRRETEHKQAIDEGAEARKQWQAFRETVSPFEGMIRAEGGEPLRAVSQLLSTAAALRTAPPPHKAQLIAGLIKQFGVPVELVDHALAGLAPPQGQPQQYAQQPQEFRDPRFDAYLQQRQQALEAKQAQELSAFEQSHEFFADVKTDMGDLMELAHRRGVALSLEDAYARACKMHPDVAPVIEQREAAKRANAASASTQQSRIAASSVKSQPANGLNGVHKGSGSARDELMAALHAGQ